MIPLPDTDSGRGICVLAGVFQLTNYGVHVTI